MRIRAYLHYINFYPTVGDHGAADEGSGRT